MSDTRVNNASNLAAPGVESTAPGVVNDAVSTSELVEARDDSFGRDQYPKEKSSVRDNGTTRRSGDSPFAELARCAAPIPVRTLGEARGIDDLLDLSLPLLAKAADVEARLGAERGPAFARLRVGSMLVAADAQQSAAMPHDESALESLAQNVVESGTALSQSEIALGLAAQSAYLPHMDINAFVQYVLRESYLIQSQIMHDFALKVRHYNELKKITRERLKDMRDLKAAYAGMDELPCVVLYLSLLDNGEWRHESMTQDDVNAHVKRMSETDGGTDAPPGYEPKVPSDLAAALVTLYNDSKLEPEDRVFLQGLVDPDNEADKDTIKEHLERIKNLLPLMNHDDLRNILIPILDILDDGWNTWETEILAIYEALPPTHCLWMIQAGKEEEYFDFGREDAETFIQFARLAGQEVANGFGSTLINEEIPDKSWSESYEVKGPEARKLLDELCKQVTADHEGRAAAIEAARAAAVGAEDSEKRLDAGAPQVGDPKMITTTEGLEAYISSLEEQLNSIGDDAQLANVDLQNALQKQQQTLQMMSNISKTLHDTAMSIIRKIGS